MIHRLRPLGAFGMGVLGDTSSTQQQIIATAQQYGVDPNLALAVAKQESGYNQNARSSAGAIGVMQLMPSTAAGLGVNPNDQTQNIQGGVKLLSQLLNQYNGNVPYALAAYNAGPGAVAKYNGVPPYAETQNYVSTIMANYNSMGGSSGSASAAASSSDVTDDSTDYPESIMPVDTFNQTDPTMYVIIGATALAAIYLFS